jgi:hypothetical protein
MLDHKTVVKKIQKLMGADRPANDEPNWERPEDEVKNAPKTNELLKGVGKKLKNI